MSVCLCVVSVVSKNNFFVSLLLLLFPSTKNEIHTLKYHIFFELLQAVASNGLWYQKRLHYVAFVTWFFIQCLRKLNYFGDLSATSKTFSSEELYIASLLCHFMGVASTNSVEIASYFIEKGNSGMYTTRSEDKFNF